MKKTFIFSLAFSSLILYFAISEPVQAARCPAEKPTYAPDLFQIDVTKNSATLYFTPVNDVITNYFIAYGYERREDRFSVSVPFGHYDGVINYTVNYLEQNTKYYFRVRADNECRQGFWSDTMSVKTNWDYKSYYRVKTISMNQLVGNQYQKKQTTSLLIKPTTRFTPSALGVSTPSAQVLSLLPTYPTLPDQEIKRTTLLKFARRLVLTLIISMPVLLFLFFYLSRKSK